MRKKAKIVGLITLLLSLSLTASCGMLHGFGEKKIDIYDNSTEAFRYFQNYNTALMEDILTYFENGDKERLKELFIAGHREKYDLDIQIEKAFDVFNGMGKVEKCDGMYAGEVGKHTVNGKNTMLEGNCEVYVTFDSGKKLRLYFLNVNINDEDLSGTGLRYIFVSDGETLELLRIIGEYNSYRKEKAE